MTTPTGESQLPGAQPLLLRRLGAFVFAVLDRERVAALEHLDARAALLAIACRSPPAPMRSEIILRLSEYGVAPMMSPCSSGQSSATFRTAGAKYESQHSAACVAGLPHHGLAEVTRY